MMKAGYLCDVRGLEIKTGADISDVRTRTGDFAADELSVIIDTPERNALVADTYLRYGQGHRGDDVYSAYGGYSAAKLRNLTHSETPWLGAEGKADNTITTKSMSAFFPTLLEETA